MAASKANTSLNAFRWSKDDSWSFRYDLEFTAQVRSHLSSSSPLYIHASYFSPERVYAALKPTCIFWMQEEEEAFRFVAKRSVRARNLQRPIEEREAMDMTRKAARDGNMAARRYALRRMGNKGGMIDKCSCYFDYDFERRAEAPRQPQRWPRRTSRMRDSGPLARWGGRLSATTVEGFAGGGVPRPRRSDPLASATIEKPIRIPVPLGLLKAAAEGGVKRQEKEFICVPLELSEDDPSAMNPLDIYPWLEPDHRCTYLGPGRGKATRHLEAVSQLGYAGGGLRRARASDDLPPWTLAGGETMGRVLPVADGLRSAAKAEARRRRFLERMERAIQEKNSEDLSKRLETETERQAPVVIKSTKQLDRMSNYEAILSAALFILAILYAWELRGRYIG